MEIAAEALKVFNAASLRSPDGRLSRCLRKSIISFRSGIPRFLILPSSGAMKIFVRRQEPG
jgi:hypothetical protein